MVGKKTSTAAAGALALFAAAFFFLVPGDAARIRKQLDIVAESIDKASGENPLMGAADAKRIRAVVTSTVTLTAPAYDYHRELAASELPALILSARSPYTELSLSFHDDTITFPNEDLAHVHVTARMRGRLPSGEWIEDVQELEMRFRESDGWRIASVDVVEVLQQ